MYGGSHEVKDCCLLLPRYRVHEKSCLLNQCLHDATHIYRIDQDIVYELIVPVSIDGICNLDMPEAIKF